MACNSIANLQFLCPSPCSSTVKRPSNTMTKFPMSSSSSSASTLTIIPNLSNKRSLSLTTRASTDRVDIDENPEGIISGEWPENFSLLSYEDLRAYLEPEIFKEKMEPSSILGEVMSTMIRTAREDQTLEEIEPDFEVVSGLPVINSQYVCVGVVSKKDKLRASNGLKSKVGEVMSSPPITLSPDKTVLDAAALMLKEKIHRIPIVNEIGQVVGIVTRTDVFKALEGLPA